MIVGTESVTRRRYDVPGTTRDSRGEVPVATFTDSSIASTVQPPSPKQLETLAEGDRTSESWAFISTSALLTIDDVTKRAADRVQVDGTWFEIRAQRQYRKVIPHWEAVGVRVGN